MNDFSDSLPSGRWVGFYVYPHSPNRHRMDLRLELKSGRISGTGIDPVGCFVIGGRIHEDRTVTWVKTYPTHEVLYSGHADHNGIWGTWSIPHYSRGGFRIWPEAWGEGIARKLKKDEDVPVEDELKDAVMSERALERVQTR